jgi:hypothetical protein
MPKEHDKRNKKGSSSRRRRRRSRDGESSTSAEDRPAPSITRSVQQRSYWPPEAPANLSQEQQTSSTENLQSNEEEVTPTNRSIGYREAATLSRLPQEQRMYIIDNLENENEQMRTATNCLLRGLREAAVQQVIDSSDSPSRMGSTVTTTEEIVNESTQEQSQPSPPPPNNQDVDPVVPKQLLKDYDDLAKKKGVLLDVGAGTDVGYLAGVPRRDVEQPSIGTTVPSEGSAVVPTPPVLNPQQRVSSRPGAFAIIPPERSRLRDILFRRNAPTPPRQPLSEMDGGATATSSHASVTVTTAPRAPEEAPAANVEQLVSATLVPPLSMAASVEFTVSTDSSGLAHRAEGLSFWAFVKRNKRAQVGIVFALFIFAALVVAVAIIGKSGGSRS